MLEVHRFEKQQDTGLRQLLSKERLDGPAGSESCSVALTFQVQKCSHYWRAWSAGEVAPDDKKSQVFR